ncbi:hypothetical protein D5S17_09415 [Pseudonocardiaceae bacterium YIM PH 21723]|nr:hypothetical protein D5S17_09415 [Pseudonocardiaceae bacterium YIM PH 21723]
MTYTIDQLRADVERQFTVFEIAAGGTVYRLRNLLRISDTERQTVMDALEQINQTDQDTARDLAGLRPAVETVLTTVTDAGRGAELIAVLGEDLAMSLRLLEKWAEATQAPEAPSSPA